ncbi:response regulator transcription factor [Roseovarius autotrophicus]|uniref:response regulator transcription factor n=1 Tax=Roseovarius autotrophicus TaxID=2824121 RepID=UPI0019F30B4E|nr:response regulator transcription factor [Roseovarius autotrophicus]MBE0452321.1 response regulator transcription factor [Roseovarius sp.]
MPRIILADDHDLVRETIAAYLRTAGGFEVSVADSLDGALALVAAPGHADLVLLDFRMPGMEALEGLARMRARTRSPVAILSGTAPPDVARRALRSGAAGFLPKTLAPQALIAAVRQMLVGETYAPCEFLRSDVDTEQQTRLGLTARERDVLTGVSEGKSNKEIARDLDIQEVTVKLHLKSLSRKLGARNRTQAAMMARDLGLT